MKPPKILWKIYTQNDLMNTLKIRWKHLIKNKTLENIAIFYFSKFHAKYYCFSKYFNLLHNSQLRNLKYTLVK